MTSPAHDATQPATGSISRWLSPNWCLSLLLLIITGFITGRWIFGIQEPDNLTFAREHATEPVAFEAVVAAYRQHLTGSPTDDVARLELVRVLQKKRPDAALSELRSVTPNTPQHLEAARLAAAISLGFERDYDALGPLKLLESKQPDDAAVQQALAEIYFRQRDFERSLEHSKRSRKLRPDNVEVCLLIAEASDSLGKTEAMIEPLEIALRLDPELPQAHLNLAYAYQSAGRFDEALPQVDWFLARYPNSIPAHRIRALTLRGQGRDQEALETIQAALKLAPKNLDCAIIAADLLLYLRRSSEAYKLLESFTADWPRERRLLTPLLRAAILSGRPDRAHQIQSQLQDLASGQ